MSSEKVAFDPTRFKEQERAGFNLVANRYEEVMKLARPSAETLLELAEINKPGLAVLDLASGPGMVARMASLKVGPTGQVFGIDIAEDALDVAKKRAEDENLSNITFEAMDAENLTYSNNHFDRAVCSFGLMHFPSPEKALSETLRVLKPGGRSAVSVWGIGEEAPFIQLALTVITRNFPPPKVERPSMFRFGKPETLKELFGKCGFINITTAKVRVRITADSTHDYWNKFLDAAGITAVALAKQPPEVRARLESDSIADLEAYRSGDIFDLTSSVMVAVGQKP